MALSYERRHLGILSHQLRPSSGAENLVGVVRNIEVNLTPAQNSGAGLDPLHSYTLNTPYRLVNDEDYLHIRYGGFFAANANTKRIEISFDGQVIHNSGLQTINGGFWAYNLTILRESATTILATGQLTWNFALSGAFINCLVANIGNLPITVSNLNNNPIVILVSAESGGAATGDIVQLESVIEIVLN